MSARPDLLGLLPFADVADHDPDALPFGDEEPPVADRWGPTALPMGADCPNACGSRVWTCSDGRQGCSRCGWSS